MAATVSPAPTAAVAATLAAIAGPFLLAWCKLALPAELDPAQQYHDPLRSQWFRSLGGGMCCSIADCRRTNAKQLADDSWMATVNGVADPTRQRIDDQIDRRRSSCLRSAGRLYPLSCKTIAADVMWTAVVTILLLAECREVARNLIATRPPGTALIGAVCVRPREAALAAADGPSV